MVREINILFLGGAKRVSLAERFIATGIRMNISINIFSYELIDDVPIVFVGQIIKGLKWNDPYLYEHLNEVITLNCINIVIPFLDHATIVCAKLKERISPNVFIPVSDFELCEIFFDKKFANDWCEAENIAVPSNNYEFPMIAKPITGSASKGIIVLENEHDLNTLCDRENYLIQKFIKGKEYSVDAYISMQNSQIISIVPRQRLETQGGESIKSITVKCAKLISFSEIIIAKSKLKGPITLQLLEEDNSGNLFFMEINPRYGGAVLNSIEAGADSTVYLIKDYLGEKNDRFDNWIDKLMMIRRFSENYKICN